tara:strand:- start:1379 stop:2023 length:645 start_codon:yes stop_codon:yes gene_type:complete
VGKSIVIVGKGPSALRSTKAFVDSFDEVAICNFPPMEGYEHLIGTRAHYHFMNAHDPNPYSRQILNELGLKYIFNTHPEPHPGYRAAFPDSYFSDEQETDYDAEFGRQIIPSFIEEHGFHPSTGTMAFDYFVKKEEFTVIGLVGFDFFKVGERGYYYPPTEVQQSLKYLYSDSKDSPFNKEGIRVNENAHNSLKSEKFVESMVKLYNKDLRVID